MSAVLSASGIEVRFGGLVALSGIDIEVQQGSIVGLVGPNGAGKSTLFNALSGFLRPGAGRVELHGRDVSRTSAHQRARAGLARTFQHPELYSEMTVREHLELARRLRLDHRRTWTDLLLARGLRPGTGDAPSSADDLTSVDRLLDSLGLTGQADRPGEGLPLGVARRVELGRALAFRPSVLLLDEPSSGLDEGETKQFIEVLLDVARQHDVAVVIVEHDVELVLSISSEIYVLDFGRLIAHGTPEQIRADPAVKAAYLGEDPTPVGSEEETSHA